MAKCFGNMSSDSSKIAIGLAIGVGTATAIGLAYLYKQKLENSPPKRWRRVGEISEIFCYPIKSCGSIKLSKVNCDQLAPYVGHMRDRSFMVITPEGQFVTGRAHPRLLLVQPRFEDDNMILSAPGMMDFTIDFKHLHTITPITASVWQQPVTAIDCGEEAAKWLSRFILSEDMGLRLVFYPLPVTMRTVRAKNVKYDTLTSVDSGALHDASSYMMMNESSVADLNSRLEQPVQAVQFRHNFLVKGPFAFEEDNWKWIRIGNNTVFKNVKLCTRCIFTNIDPDTAKRNENKEPLTTLKGYRSIIPNDSPCMGIHMGNRVNGEVALGDAVYVEDTSK